MSKKKLIPINRSNKFFSIEDFELEIDLGREYSEGDLNMVLVLYRVDKQKSDVDSLYGEAYGDEIRFHPPVELKVIFNLEAPENKTYNNGMLRYLQHGKLKFGIYQQQLDELAVDINYGDYIGFPETEKKMVYFTVVNDGKKFSDNTHTILGVKGVYRSLECVPADINEIRLG